MSWGNSFATIAPASVGSRPERPSISLEWKNRKFVFSSDTFPNKWFIVPYDLVNKVFVGHLHSDHVGDFAAWHIGGWVGGRQRAPIIWGPDAPKDRPEWGTKRFVEHQIESYS